MGRVETEGSDESRVAYDEVIDGARVHVGGDLGDGAVRREVAQHAGDAGAGVVLGLDFLDAVEWEG